MDTVDLIRTIEKYPMLYDPRIKCTGRAKSLKWEEIADQFCLTASAAKSRWRSVKEKYILLRRRADAYPGTHLAQQIEEYKYASFLTFLDDIIDFAYAELPPPPRHSSSKYVPLSRSWDKSHTLLLIKQLSMHPLLYDTTHPLYCHNIHRMAAYRKIASVLKRYKPEITQEMVSKKIQTVRTQYTREKKYLQKLKEKYGRPCPPKLWFYNKLYFLENAHDYSKKSPSVEDVTHMFEQSDHNEEMENMMMDDEIYLEDRREATEDEGDDDINDVDEWLSSRDDSTKPFEEVEIKHKELNYAEEDERVESFDGEAEEGFDYRESNNEGSPKNTKRDEIYAQCSGLLESLAKQLRPFEKDSNVKKTRACDCENSAPSTLLGKMIETELGPVSEKIYLDAKWKIIRILEEAQRKHLAEVLQ